MVGNDDRFHLVTQQVEAIGIPVCYTSTKMRIPRRLRAARLICHTRGCMRPTDHLRRVLALVACLVLTPSRPFAQEARTATTETFHYRVEWRFIEAGRAKLVYTQPESGGLESIVDLESTGLVSRLFKVKDVYNLTADRSFCATAVLINAQEGKRRRETRITFDGNARKAQYVERDLAKNNQVLNTKEIDTAACVYDVIGGLAKLRGIGLEPGQNTTLPISDGKKFVQARVEAQEREEIKTPAGTFKAIRLEATLFNNVLYSRSGRLFVWLSDDDRRIPVQIQARLRIHIGTITLQLSKEELS